MQTTSSINIRVELFGTCRLRGGLREVGLTLPPVCGSEAVVHALALACPALVGPVLKDDLSGLQDGYVFNLNGTLFLSDGSFTLAAGDSLLLLSNQAGG